MSFGALEAQRASFAKLKSTPTRSQVDAVVERAQCSFEKMRSL